MIAKKSWAEFSGDIASKDSVDTVWTGCDGSILSKAGCKGSIELGVSQFGRSFDFGNPVAVGKSGRFARVCRQAFVSGDDLGRDKLARLVTATSCTNAWTVLELETSGRTVAVWSESLV